LELHLVNSFPFRSEKNKLGTAFLKKESLLNNKNYINIYFMPKSQRGEANKEFLSLLSPKKLFKEFI